MQKELKSGLDSPANWTRMTGMLSFDDLVFKEKPGLYKSTVVSSGVVVTAACTIDDLAMECQPKAELMESAKKAVRYQLWEIIYGELEQPLLELESEVRHEILCRGDGSCLDGQQRWEEIEPLFKRLRELVQPPKPPQS